VATQSDKTEKVVAFPKSELAIVVETISSDLELADKHLQGKGLIYDLFVVWLNFFRQLKEERLTDPVQIRKALDDVGLTYFELVEQLGVPPLNNPSLEQLLKFGRDLAEAATKLKQVPDLEARVFAAEAALELRSQQLASAQEAQAQIGDLEARAFAAETALEQRSAELALARAALAQARLTEQDQIRKVRELVLPVLKMGTNEIGYFERVARSVETMKSGLATALSQLADAIGEKGAQQATASAKPEFADVSAEIERRVRWLEQIRPLIEEYGDQRDSIAASLTTTKEQVKFADGDVKNQRRLERQQRAVGSQLATLLLSEQEVLDQLSKLQGYQRAVEIVTAGGPKALFGVQLPELPEAPEVSEYEASAEATPEESRPPAVPSGERRQKLESIAHTTGLPAEAVLMITLYDSLPEPMRAKRKSVQMVVSAADKCGILTILGFASREDVMARWGSNSEGIKTYLKYWGSPSGIHLYGRLVNVPLTWDRADVLTAEEEESYQADLIRRG